VKTYILGAGASKSAGYPLARELAGELGRWMRSARRPAPLILGDSRDLLDELERHCGSLDSADFEDVLTRLDPEGDVHLRSALTRALQQFFDELRSHAKPDKYRQFAQKVVTSGDCVITFNYDVSVEPELKRAGKWEVADGYGFQVELSAPVRQSPVQVLKLHGSTNWVALMDLVQGFQKVDPDRVYPDRPILYSPELEFLGYQGLGDRKAREGADAGAHVTMILPERSKRFLWKDLFDCLWGKAEAALRESEEIVVVGYSLPLADQRARAMILNRSRKGACVTVCCGRDSDKIAREFRESGFTNVNWIQGSTFEEWGARTP